MVQIFFFYPPSTMAKCKYDHILQQVFAIHVSLSLSFSLFILLLPNIIFTLQSRINFLLIDTLDCLSCKKGKLNIFVS